MVPAAHYAKPSHKISAAGSASRTSFSRIQSTLRRVIQDLTSSGDVLTVVDLTRAAPEPLCYCKHSALEAQAGACIHKALIQDQFSADRILTSPVTS